MKISEIELTKKVKTKLNSLFDNFEIYEEVGLFNRNIDMLLLSNQTISSIEFKINDWKKAIEQIDDYMLVSDYGYLCMPQRKISEKLTKILNEKGIGLLLYNHIDDNVTEEISPKISNKKIDYYQEQVINKIITNKELYRSCYA